MHDFDVEKLRRRIVDIKEEWEAGLIGCAVDEIDYSTGVIRTCEVTLKKIDKLL